jgi:hypothetical protein
VIELKNMVERILWSLWRSNSVTGLSILFDAGAVAVFGPGTKISDAAIKILEILIGINRYFIINRKHQPKWCFYI